MLNGTMGIIGCPILEDEIIYSLSSDEDEKKIYIVDTPPSNTLKKKLHLKGIDFSTVDEWEFNNGFLNINRENGFNIVVYMNKLGLHKDPKFLRETLEGQLIQHQSKFDVIALYYGMCGNAGWDISNWASDNLDIPVFVFRDDNDEVCDDCIGVAVGGHFKYCNFVKKHTGMFFVTPAIAGNWGEYSEELNFTKGFEIMDIHTVKEVFEIFGYTKAVRIDTGIGIKGEELDKGCERFSEITGLEFITAAPGSADLFPTERIYKDAKGSLLH
ncbi:hypothetical protein Mpt1_c10480 [Candidatus Methanoplasma termitum]|uniref:DUF1638 domain-containing protein n=1 Tax=Candidatus Methanoplasma termitum TaxID=1577791 RepID=A0A0A7LHC0_9ARCH|nr:DUF1638 domain-containing protein [Candidatus Methanoplasma termitum]AIZ56916.1 hypothetical protein Mpt1_c10480 [Candidatus Methanoplasma termitum]MCL2333685.1 DUF1638 domain-containing protein [Candidatus Methanoplasma sp.]